MTSTSDAEISAAYSARADEYVALLGSVAQMDDEDRLAITAWRDSTTGTLLDAGSGPGHWTRVLSVGGRDARGVDVTPAFVTSARSRFPGLSFEVGSFRDLPVEDASLGGILAWYSLIHTSPGDIPAVLDEFARVLAPGGSLLVGFFDGAPGAPFAHAVTTAYTWSADALAGFLETAGFSVTATSRRDPRPGTAGPRTHGAVTAVRSDVPAGIRRNHRRAGT